MGDMPLTEMRVDGVHSYATDLLQPYDDSKSRAKAEQDGIKMEDVWPVHSTSLSTKMASSSSSEQGSDVSEDAEPRPRRESRKSTLEKGQKVGGSGRRFRSRSEQAEARALAKARKTRQDELDALEVTFFEIESWIDKTMPAITRMTGELHKAATDFDAARNCPLLLKAEREEKEALERKRGASAVKTSLKHNFPERQLSSSSLSTHTGSSSLTTIRNEAVDVPLKLDPTQSVDAPGDVSAPPQQSITWSITFEQGGTLRLQTNITQVDQLVAALRKFEDLTQTEPSTLQEPRVFVTKLNPDGSVNNVKSSFFALPSQSDASGPHAHCEYWRYALSLRPPLTYPSEAELLRPPTALAHISRDIVDHVIQVYIDCLFPKPSLDQHSFWHRHVDPTDNVMCVNASLALAFHHFVRHDLNTFPPARIASKHYYEAAKSHLNEVFDTPSLAAVEALASMSVFQLFGKHNSMAKTFLGIAVRMLQEMGYTTKRKLSELDPALRLHALRIYMNLWYCDWIVEAYSADGCIVKDEEFDIDFLDIIPLGTQVMYSQLEDTKGRDAHEMSQERANLLVEKETYYVYQIRLLQIGKRIQKFVKELRTGGTMGQAALQQKKALEDALCEWYRGLLSNWWGVTDPEEVLGEKVAWEIGGYQPAATALHGQQDQPKAASIGRDPHQPRAVTCIRSQTALNLFLQYEAEWVMLEKPWCQGMFPSNLSESDNVSKSSTPMSFPPTPPNSSSQHYGYHHPQNLPRPRPSATSLSPFNGSSPSPSSTASAPPSPSPDYITFRAALNIIRIATYITHRHGWCVVQPFVVCIYEASTIILRWSQHLKRRDLSAELRHPARLIKQTIDILESAPVYSGLPEDLAICLKQHL